MPTTVRLLPKFRRRIKRLKRKYSAVTSEANKLVAQLESNQRPGDKMVGTAYDLYKVRLPNPSARRGKSGGFRVIYYVEHNDSLWLVTIYSKTEDSNISTETILRALAEIGLAD